MGNIPLNGRTTAIPLGILLLLSLVFFSPVVLQSRTFYAFDFLSDYLPWSPFFPPDFAANNELISDPVNLIYPYHKMVKDALATGRLPLWDPLVFSGLPVNTSGTPLSNPFSLLFTQLFSLTAAHDLVLFVHLFGAGVGMFLFLRRLGLCPYPAMVGASLWMFNGYAMVWFEFEIVTILACSLPFSLYFLERCLESASLTNCLFLCAVLALAVSSGFPHLIIYQFVFLGVYFLYRVAGKYRRGRLGTGKGTGRTTLWVVAASSILFLGVCTNLVCGFLPYLEDSQRKAFPIEQLYQRTGQLLSPSLITVLYPDYFGNPASTEAVFTPRQRGKHPYNNYNELCVYAGAAAVFLSLTALIYARRIRYSVFFAAAAFFSIWGAMGSPLYFPMAETVPGLRFSTPTRILYIFGFSVSVLSALGLNFLTTAKDFRKEPLFLAWAGVVLLAVFLYIFPQTDFGLQWASEVANRPGEGRVIQELKNHYRPDSAVLLYPLLLVLAAFLCVSLLLRYADTKPVRWIQCLLALLVWLDLMGFGLAYNTRSPTQLEYPSTPAIRHLSGIEEPFRIITYGPFMSNGMKPFGIEDVGGYSPFYPRRYGEYLHVSQFGMQPPIPSHFSRWTEFRTFASPLLSLLNIRYILAPPTAVVKKSPNELDTAFRKEILILENKNAFPRSFFVPQYTVCESREQALQRLAEFTHEDFRRAVILEEPPPQGYGSGVSAPPVALSATADILEYEANTVRVRITAPSSGFLILGDNYHPGWKAFVDGRARKILRANYVMRAVPVEKGSHTVVMKFNPVVTVAGLLISWASWAILTAALLTISGSRLFGKLRRGGGPAGGRRPGI